MRSRIDPLKKFARTVRNHRELLLNYFRARRHFSSGVIEGLNNTAKVTIRKAYGIRTFKATQPALYHVLGKLPEPPLAHSLYLRTKKMPPGRSHARCGISPLLAQGGGQTVTLVPCSALNCSSRRRVLPARAGT